MNGGFILKVNWLLFLSLFLILLCCVGIVSASEANNRVDTVNIAEEPVETVNDGQLMYGDKSSSILDTPNDSDCISSFQEDNIALGDRCEGKVENNNLSVKLKTKENEMGSDSINSPLSQNNDLTFGNNENMVLTDSLNIKHVYVSPDGEGNGTINNQSSFEYSIENIQDNTIIHMTDGCYNVTSTLSISSKQNITIVADNPGKVFITGGNISLDYLISLYGVYNFTFKNIIVRDAIHNKGFIYVRGNDPLTKKIFFENCSFINCTNGNLLNLEDVKDSFSIIKCYFANNTVTSILNLHSTNSNHEGYLEKNPILDLSRIEDCTFENNIVKNQVLYIRLVYDLNINGCKFINNLFSDSNIYITNLHYGSNSYGGGPYRYSALKLNTSINIFDCEFNNSNDALPAVHVNGLNIGGMQFDDNIVDSKYGIKFDENSLFFNHIYKEQVSSNGYTWRYVRIPTELHSPIFISVLNDKTLIAPGDKINLTATIVDYMGNAIDISNLKLIVFGEVCPATFVDGFYYAEFTVPEYLGLIDINVDFISIVNVNFIGIIPNDNYAEFSHFDSEMCTVTVGSLLVKPTVNFVLYNISPRVYGDNVTVKVDLPGAVSGNLAYLIMRDGIIVRNVTDLVKDSASSVSFDNLSAGDYSVKIIYDGGENHAPSSITSSFSVTKANPSIQLIADSFVDLGEDIIVQAVLPADANGYVNFIFNGITRNVAVVDGVAKTKFKGLTQEGNYTLFASYSDNNYNPVETNLTIKNKVDSSLNLTYSPPVAGGDVIITIKMDEEINDNVTVTINGKSENRTLINGTATIVLSKVSVNEIYTIGANYEGKGKFKDASNSTTFKVYKLDTNISTSVKQVKLGEVAEITINVDLNATGIISVGNKYSAVIKKGTALVRILGLGIGNYTYSVVYYGDDTFNSNQTTVTFSVKIDCSNETTISGINGLTTAGNVIGISLPVDAEGIFTIVVDGNPVSVGVVNGSASIPISGLDGGKHNITVIYSGDEKYAGYIDSRIVEVAKLTPNATIYLPSKVTAGKSTTIKINLQIDATGYVVVEVAGKKYDNIKVVNGVATVNIAGLKAGEPVLKYTYKGNGKYASVSGSTKLKVVDSKVTVTLKKVKVKKSAKKLTLQSTIKIDSKTKKGLKVTFKFNGKKIGTAKTNAKGIAKITIKKSVLKKLKVGKKLTYSATYGKASDKKTVKIKK